MLDDAICSMGRRGDRVIDSVQKSDRKRFVKGISRDSARHTKFSGKTGMPVVASQASVRAESGHEHDGAALVCGRLVSDGWSGIPN